MTLSRPGGPWQRGSTPELGRLEYQLPSSATVLGYARQLTRSACRRWVNRETCDTVLLVLSELLGNAVKAAVGPSVLLRLSWTARRIRIEVEDDSSVVPAPRQATETDEGGRGLLLVTQLAVRWGSFPIGRGKCVWAEVALPP